MDHKITRDIIDRFANTARKAQLLDGSESYAYTSGFFQSAYFSLLEKVPADVCFAELQMLERLTREYEKKIVENNLSAKEKVSQ